jgi:hypothetical protein
MAAAKVPERLEQQIDVANLPLGMQADLGLVDENQAAIFDDRSQPKEASDDAKLARAGEPRPL